MFGLSMLQTPGTQRPALFDNPAFKRAKTWTVSTSHLTHPKFDNWGWGEVVPDGVGVAYSIHPGKCVFNVTARREQDLARPLGHYLQEALEDMRAVLEAEKKKGGGGKKSKL
jgi:carnitine O-acetyltransferase